MYPLKALWRFRKKSDEVFWPLGVSPKSRMGRKEGPERVVWGRKVKSAWQTGSSGPSDCLPSRFHLAQAQFQIQLQHILTEISLKIWRDWKGCVAQSLVLRELTRAETFLQLNLKLKEILSGNEASCPWTQPVRPDLEFDQKSKKLDLEFDTWKWTEPVIKPEGCQKARYWAW